MATTARGATRTRSRSSGAAASETSRQSTRGATLSPPEKFVGFSDEAIQFLLELQAEQSRTWFKVHQDDYVRLCRRPLELLVFELQERLSDVYPRIADVEPHIFRIQRDTRFSKDKSPYKTNLAANMAIRPPSEGEDQHTTPGMYFSFGLDGEYVGIGAWHMDAPVLQRYRSLVDDARTGAQLQKIVTKLQREGWGISSMEALKRVPAPYAQDHPRAELLKRKGMAASIQPGPGVSATAELVDWAEARLREAAPMITWLDRNL